MSKTVLLHLDEWTISWTKEGFSGGHYQATTRYASEHQNQRVTSRDYQDFETYEEARAWIDAELATAPDANPPNN